MTVENNTCRCNCWTTIHATSGIHAFRANRVDIINNTAYLNSASRSLQYAQIFANDSEDVRIINNILVAPIADVAAGEKLEPVNVSPKSPTVLYTHNLYFGGNIAPTIIITNWSLRTSGFCIRPNPP